MGLARNLRRLTRKKEAATAKKYRRKAVMEPLEPRLLLSADLSYTMSCDAKDLTLALNQIDGVDTFQLIDIDTSQVLASQALINTSGIVITGSAGDDRLIVDDTVPDTVSMSFVDSSTSDNDVLEFTGGGDRTWNITGAGSGGTGNVSFSGIENLTGAADNEDTFVFTQDGSLAGTINGRAGGFDSLDVQESYTTIALNPSGPDAGSVTLDSQVITYAGLESIITDDGEYPISEESVTFSNVGFLAGNDKDRDVFLSILGDTVTLKQYNLTQLAVYEGDVAKLIFNKPSDSLEIHLGLGNDTLTVRDLGTVGFALLIFGGYNNDAGFLDGSDTVIFQNTSDFEGNALQVEAETVTVDSSVQLSTGKSGAASGSIEFSGDTINIQTGAKLLATAEGSGGTPADITLTAKTTDYSGISPIDVFPVDDVSINVLTGAEIKGGQITLTADRTSMLAAPLTVVAVQSKTASINITGATISGTSVTIEAETADQKPLEDGDMSYFNNYVLGPVLDYGDILGTVLGAIPVLGPLLQAVSVSIRSAESYVTLDGATITSSGDVTINAETVLESVASASGGMDLRSGGGAGSTGSQLAGSAPFAVSYSESNATAITTLTGNTSITSTAGTVSVGSDIKNTTEAESTTFINSEAGKGTVKTSVGGLSVAVTNSETKAKTLIGEGVTIDADGNANVTAVGDLGNTANAGVTIFVDGFGGVSLALGFDKADIRTEVYGTIIAGGEKTVLDLATTGVDTTNDKITITDHGLETGQELIYLAVDPDYAIGGLEPGTTYRVVVVDKDTIQLVRGETSRCPRPC